MREYTWSENGFTFKRISRKKARTAYNNGLPVIACPVNLRPGKPWSPEIIITPDPESSFEQIENAFYFYNIRNTETGRYIAWYIPVRIVDRFTGEEPTPATLGTVEAYDERFLTRYYRKEDKTA